MDAFGWTCPHCDRPQTGGASNTFEQDLPFEIGVTAQGSLGLSAFAVRCLNDECNKTTFSLQIGRGKYVPYGWTISEDDLIFSERLIPRGASVPQPDYIPAPIREDYEEACLIRDFSPKASATLSRRCIQGIIRDFAGISKGTLDAEIKALLSAVNDGSADRSITLESVHAIDHVRKIGNIGAHMERDINVIIDVDPGEAQALIELVELLLSEWYVARHVRQEKFAALAAISQQKDQAKAQAKAVLLAPANPQGLLGKATPSQTD